MTEKPSLDNLQERIDALKDEITPPPSSEPTQASGMSMAMRIGVELVAGVGVGAATGYFLDKWLDTTPWLMIVCFFLGCAAGFKNMKRTVDQADKTS